jgi:hypothetical protein
MPYVPHRRKHKQWTPRALEFMVENVIRTKIAPKRTIGTF